jgi:hypothetical protein
MKIEELQSSLKAHELMVIDRGIERLIYIYINRERERERE